LAWLCVVKTRELVTFHLAGRAEKFAFFGKVDILPAAALDKGQVQSGILERAPNHIDKRRHSHVFQVDAIAGLRCYRYQPPSGAAERES